MKKKPKKELTLLQKQKEMMKKMKSQIRRGDYYIDCGSIPRVCIYVDKDTISGISLIATPKKRTPTGWGNCSVRACGPRKVSQETALRWAVYGPNTKKERFRMMAFYGSKEWGGRREIWWENQDGPLPEEYVKMYGPQHEAKKPKTV